MEIIVKPVKLIINGAGSRSSIYAKFAMQHPNQALIVGVAEGRPDYRNYIAKVHQIPKDNIFDD